MKLLVPTATASPQALEEAGRQPGPCPLPSLGLALGGPSMGLSELHSFLSPWTERVGTGLRFSLETPTVLPANVCQLTKPRALVNVQTHPCPKRTFRPSPPPARPSPSCWAAAGGARARSAEGPDNCRTGCQPRGKRTVLALSDAVEFGCDLRVSGVRGDGPAEATGNSVDSAGRRHHCHVFARRPAQ